MDFDDPYAIDTSDDENTENQRQELNKQRERELERKKLEKREHKAGAYGIFVPKDGVNARLTIEEIEEIVTGNYKPLAGPPEQTAPDTAPATGNAYEPISNAYGGMEGAITMDGKSYSAYNMPQAVQAELEELKKLTNEEKTARRRYEKWAKERETGDFSLFDKTEGALPTPTKQKTEKVKMKSWNQAFLEAQDLPENTPEQVLIKYRLLSKLSTDFIEIAKVYGRTVISEFFLNEKMKTCEKICLGGVAGGTKYIVRGILFKLAVDPAVSTGFIYGGRNRNFEYANKAAGHELKGAINMHKYYKKGICVPMQALVDFHGYRLVAMPLLPLKDGKLIYGSKDGGKTIHHSDPKFNEWMEGIAEDLHLAGHSCLDGNRRPHKIYSAGDVEGHIGSDGRYYLIDLARAFPPESIWHTHHLYGPPSAVFFRMLRPEFLQWLKKNHKPNKPEEKFPPLSCDALTNWGRDGKDHKEQNDRLIEATKVLINKVVPEFAASFVQKTPRQLRDIQVSEELHRDGINVRHMGLVRFMITGTDESSVAAKRTLLVSMVGRTLKNLLRREMRVEHDRHQFAQPSDHDSRSMTVEFLNLVTRADPEDSTVDEFWGETVPFGLMKRFGQMALSQTEQENLFSAIKDDVAKIVKYIVSTTGVQIHPAAMRTLEQNGAGFEFVSVDLGALTVRIKHMSVIDYATAKVLSQEAYQGGVGTAGDRLLSLARRQFNRTLQSDPLNDVCKREAHITRLRIVARKYENRTALAGVNPMGKARYFMMSDESLFAACSEASRGDHSRTDSDDLANMIRAILTTWSSRKRGKQSDLFQRCGGAANISYVKQLIKFVESTKNRLLTLELCAFLATCKDPGLTTVFHHFVKEMATKEEKDIRAQGIPPMEVRSSKAKGPTGPIPIDEHLVQRLVDKLRKKETPNARTLVTLSNLLAATERPEFWIEAANIGESIIKNHGKDAFFRWYASSPWNLRRGEQGGQLSDGEAKAIAHVITQLSPLSILDLRGLKMRDDHVKLIAQACARLPTGTVFSELKSNHSLPVQQLRANDLEELEFTQMVSQDVVWLFALLRENKSVQRIKLAHTDLDMLECKAICEGLCNPSIKEFRLVACDIDDDELKVLAGAFANLPKLEVLDLSGNVFTDAGGRLVGRLKMIREIDLSECKGITDATVAAIAKDCKNVKALNLSQCAGVSDIGAASIAKMVGLEKLNLEECSELTDRAIKAIARGCKSLRDLNVANCTKLGGGSLTALARECKQLEALNLSFCENVQDHSVFTLAKGCPGLMRISLGHCGKLTDKSVAQIGISCSQLQALDLSVCEKITDEAITEIAKGCHGLKELNLGVCEKVTDLALSALAEHCRGLEILNISCCDKVTDESITKLTKCTELKSLNLYSCKQVTDASIKELASKCKKLRHLDLFWCEKIKEDAIEQLMKNNPECKIDR